MAIIRLAGAGLKALAGMGAKEGAKQGIKALGGRTLGSIAREGLVDAAVIGGVTQIPGAVSTGYGLATGDAIDDRLTDLTSRQRADGTYKIGLGDKALSSLSQMLGGEGITQDTIKDKATQIKSKAVEDAYKEKIGAFGGNYTKGMSEGEALQELSRAQTAKEQSDYKGSVQYQDAINERDYNRTIADIAREDRLAAQSDAREDRLLDRRQTLDMNMANLAFKEAESKRQFDIESKRSHKEKMAAIIAGLAGLGGAFAI